MVKSECRIRKKIKMHVSNCIPLRRGEQLTQHHLHHSSATASSSSLLIVSDCLSSAVVCDGLVHFVCEMIRLMRSNCWTVHVTCHNCIHILHPPPPPTT